MLYDHTEELVTYKAQGYYVTGFTCVLYLCETPVRHISDPIVSDVTTFCGRLGDAAGNKPHRKPGPNVSSAAKNYWNGKRNVSLPTSQRSCLKVMFSVVCVCLSVCSQQRGVPMWALPIMHWTSLYRHHHLYPTPSTGTLHPSTTTAPPSTLPPDLFKLVHFAPPHRPVQTWFTM